MRAFARFLAVLLALTFGLGATAFVVWSEGMDASGMTAMVDHASVDGECPTCNEELVMSASTCFVGCIGVVVESPSAIVFGHRPRQLPVAVVAILAGRSHPPDPYPPKLPRV